MTLCLCASCIRRKEVLHRSRSNSAPVHTEKYTTLDSEYLINSTLIYFSIILHSHLNLKHAGSLKIFYGLRFALVWAFSFPVRSYFLGLWKTFKLKERIYPLKQKVKHIKKKSSTFIVQGLSEQILFLLSGTIKQWQPHGTFCEKYPLSGALQDYQGAINTQFIYLIACEGSFEPLLSFVGNELPGICSNSVHFHGTTMPLP